MACLTIENEGKRTGVLFCDGVIYLFLSFIVCQLYLLFYFGNLFLSHSIPYYFLCFISLSLSLSVCLSPSLLLSLSAPLHLFLNSPCLYMRSCLSLGISCSWLFVFLFMTGHSSYCWTAFSLVALKEPLLDYFCLLPASSCVWVQNTSQA